ncbi:hypothetical protein P7K49_020563, partial [Saguinus oedipus]
GRGAPGPGRVGPAPGAGRGVGWAVAPLCAGRGGWRSGGRAAAAVGKSAACGARPPSAPTLSSPESAAAQRPVLTPHRDPAPRRPSMGARASGGPLARAGLLLLLLLLLLGLLAAGVQGARGRGGAEKNSYRRTVNTFSQSVSSLFGEDNVRAAQKVGAGPAPTVTLPRPPRTWRQGPACEERGLRGCPAGWRAGRGGPACASGPAARRPRRAWPVRVWAAGPRGVLSSAPRFSLDLAPAGGAVGASPGCADARRASHSFIDRV